MRDTFVVQVAHLQSNAAPAQVSMEPVAVTHGDLGRIYARIRSTGPSFWADGPGSGSRIGMLEPTRPLDRAGWRATVREELRSRELFGWFGYEAGGWAHRQPSRSPGPLPDAWLGRVRAELVVRDGRAWIRGDRDAAVALREAVGGGVATPERTPTGRVVSHADRALFERGVRAVLGHLRAGDCYQVNLAREIRIATPGDPFDVWSRLRASNPSRRGALIETPYGAIVCNSPELLMEARGGRVVSVPIKGTAPIHDDPRVLLRSAKERAELTMIVDLVRADLGRVARTGTVVAGPRRVGRVGHVWHAVQRVGCTLADEADAVDAFAALFPAGSVTGAPRERAMEVIHALEPGRRGVYCGAVGGFGADGAARWSVAIRTITFAGGEATLHVGAGIVLGSVPSREYDETSLKASRMLAAVCG